MFATLYEHVFNRTTINGFQPFDNCVKYMLIVCVLASATSRLITITATTTCVLHYLYHICVKQRPTNTMRVSPRKHVMMISHYRESMALLLRTLTSIERACDAAPGIDVQVVLAIEQSSLRISEEWPDNWYTGPLHVTEVIHTLSNDERAGLSSNLRCASKHLWDHTPHDDRKHILVTKLDGNVVISANYLSGLDRAWMETNGDMYQPHITSLSTEFEEYDQMSAISRLFQCIGSPIATRLSTLVESTLFSSYAITLSCIAAADFWDRTLIHEDQLMWLRVRTGTPSATYIRCPDISVYNAPPLYANCMYQQLKRCTTGILTNIVLAFTHKLRWQYRIQYSLFTVTPLINILYMMYTRTWVSTIPCILMVCIYIHCFQHIDENECFRRHRQTVCMDVIGFLFFIMVSGMIGMMSFVNLILYSESSLVYHTTVTI